MLKKLIFHASSFSNLDILHNKKEEKKEENVENNALVGLLDFFCPDP